MPFLRNKAVGLSSDFMCSELFPKLMASVPVCSTIISSREQWNTLPQLHNSKCIFLFMSLEYIKSLAVIDYDPLGEI